jgi:diguanylate cyclase (GGDEF)-like protein
MTRMQQKSGAKVFLEILGWTLVFMSTAVLAVALNVHHYVDAFLDAYHGYYFDDLFISLNIAGLIGLIYSLVRVKDLTLENRRRREAERNVEWLATHDALTELPNRRMLDRVLADAASAYPRTAHTVFSIDLDGFKRVNDLFGHAVGNEVLKTVAERLKASFPDDTIYRIGGDEFLVVTQGVDVNTASAASQRILQQLTAPIDADVMTVDVGASVGYAFSEGGADALNTAILHSDYAMYTAKSSGRNRAMAFAPSMEHDVYKRARLEGALKRAVREGTIIPHFQPLIDLKSNRVNGFEALARWELQPGEFISPGEFIPLAEETGLIVPLTEHLLRLCCIEARNWPLDVGLAFNLSPVLLSDAVLGLRLIKIMSDEGFSPSRLELEITESSVMKDYPAAQKVLSDLMNAGARIALGDFGTGYSSLSQLSGFSFDTIKIDRSFVTAMNKGERQDKVIRAIVALGSGLGVKTTAEGIEDEEQLAYLRSLGCDIGQGYLLGRPMPAEAARRFMQERLDNPLAASDDPAAEGSVTALSAQLRRA